jgi:hypothetical protein
MARSSASQIGIAFVFGLVGGAVLFRSPAMLPAAQSLLATATASNCVIKGNISINSGEHIYHVPGQRDYASTRISPEYGERWFCSEEEARQAGWRRAGR